MDEEGEAVQYYLPLQNVRWDIKDGDFVTQWQQLMTK